MSNKNPNTPIVMQGESIRILKQAPGETIEQMCARLAGSGPTRTALSESAKPPTIYPPRRNSGRIIAIALIAVVMLVLVATIAVGGLK